jgi:hypothetical protein
VEELNVIRMTTNTVAWPLETRKTRTWARGGCHVGVPDIERQSERSVRVTSSSALEQSVVYFKY